MSGARLHIGDARGSGLTEQTTSNAGRIALGAIVVAAIGIAVFVFFPRQAPTPEPAPIAQAEPVVEGAPEMVAEPEPKAPPPPVFDTFRVEPDGSMVVAGRAQPGQVVDIMLAGTALERVTADGSGSFVAFPMAGLSDQPRKLSLLADPDGEAVASETSFIVAPIIAPQPTLVQPAEPAAPDGPVAEAAPELDLAADSGSVTLPLPDPAVADAVPQSPTVLQADADGITVVQSTPSPTAQVVSPNVALDAITYDPQGEVQLSGRAAGDGAVQIYLDNEPVLTSPVEAGGDWRIDLPDVDTGLYTLRIDEVDAAGDVVSRIETPFRREEAEDVAAVLAEETSQDGFDVAVRTVQPGSTLWAIAEENLGGGVFYVEVFEANRDLIKDPNLIYPGQIFRIPEMPE